MARWFVIPANRTILASLAVLLSGLFALYLPISAGARHGATGSMVQSVHVIARGEPGVTRRRVMIVASEVNLLFTHIRHDLGAAPPRLQVDLYASHWGFARAFRSRQGAHPQSSTDDASAIVRNTLLLGPLPTAYLQHNLAHVYTEWIIDRLTSNRTDALPSTPWLYDGLAEYEAYRYEPADLRCVLRGPSQFDITTVRTARQWLARRAGPLGALEYCLAYARTHDLVRRLGWSSVPQALHHGWNWPTVARHLLAAWRALTP